jgi:hypothetical protein
MEAVAWLVGIATAISIAFFLVVLGYGSLAGSFEWASRLLGLPPIAGWFLLGSALGMVITAISVRGLIPTTPPTITHAKVKHWVKVHLILAGSGLAVALIVVTTLAVHAGGWSPREEPPPAVAPAAPAPPVKKPRKPAKKTAPGNPAKLFNPVQPRP